MRVYGQPDSMPVPMLIASKYQARPCSQTAVKSSLCPAFPPVARPAWPWLRSLGRPEQSKARPQALARAPGREHTRARTAFSALIDAGQADLACIARFDVRGSKDRCRPDSPGLSVRMESARIAYCVVELAVGGMTPGVGDVLLLPGRQDLSSRLERGDALILGAGARSREELCICFLWSGSAAFACALLLPIALPPAGQGERGAVRPGCLALFSRTPDAFAGAAVPRISAAVDVLSVVPGVLDEMQSQGVVRGVRGVKGHLPGSGSP